MRWTFKNICARACFINTTVYVLHRYTSLFPPYSLDRPRIKCIKKFRITGSRVRILLEASFFSNLNGASLHSAFHARPSIVLIWLKQCWKGRKKQLIHPSEITGNLLYGVTCISSSIKEHMLMSGIRRNWHTLHMADPLTSNQQV